MSDYIAQRVREARKADLIRKGASEEQAEKILARQDKSSRETGRIFLVLGIIMLVIGLGVTIGTYGLASANGGVFIVTIGLIATGAGNIVYGRSRMSSGL